MNTDLNLLLRLHEIYEAKLSLFSSEFTCSAARLGYEHEYTEAKEILELLDRLIDERN